MAMKIFLVVVVIVLFSSNGSFNEAEAKRSILISKYEDLELERQLQILNKPPTKSIRTKVGDIFDCVSIDKQPAFDHPLLKNHKIQMEPGFIKEETSNGATPYSSTAKVSKTMLELHSESCPPGTVPIRRTTKQDLVNAKYFSQWTQPYHTNSYPVTPMRHHFVSVESDSKDQIYSGGQATISIQNPPVQQDQFSTAQLWIQNNALGAEEINSIEFGWAVYPILSGDNHTRIFGYWTADGYKNTGCFNMLCSGFVQIHTQIALGDVLPDISVYGGQQYLIDVMVTEEPETSNWWLTVNGDKRVGYWPGELFTHLKNNATVIRYGGVAGANQNKPTPPMGNGNSPTPVYNKVCYMWHMKVITEDGKSVDFDPYKVLPKGDATKDCYDIEFERKKFEKPIGAVITFGGPGGDCP